jgi:hypothetical protein
MTANTTNLYTAVQHDGYIAIHLATVDETGKIIYIEPAEQKLTDLNKEPLIDFVSQVMVGLQRKTVDAATFAELSKAKVA